MLYIVQGDFSVLKFKKFNYQKSELTSRVLFLPVKIAVGQIAPS